MKEKFKNTINNSIIITNEEWTVIANALIERSLLKDDFLLREGQYCNTYYFVLSGCLKVGYYYDDVEKTNWFAFEDYFFTELDSYRHNKPTKYFIKAIENTELLIIERSKMNYLNQNVPHWHEYMRINHEDTIIKLNEILNSFQTETAEDRYNKLFEHPEYIQRIKQKDLSSMLGITHHSLSRLRKKK